VPDDEQKRDKNQPEAGQQPAGGKAASAPEEAADKFRPDAIAARVDAALGEETELDRVAREEEKKLLERKKQTKGKRGLEAAASKRLAKIGEGTVKRPSSAVAAAVAPEADPLIERARRAGQWIRENRQVFGGLVTVAVLGVGGALGWMYWQDKHQADASAVLAQAFADERGRVSAKDDDEEDDTPKRAALYPTFKSATERRDAALAKYRQVQSKYPGTGAAYLARLSEAGLLLDQGDAKGALAAYGDVKGSPLAQADVEVRARAFEGMGFADELLAQSDAAGKDKHQDDALAAYKQLEQLDVKGFKELGMYHEARVLQAKGEQQKAIDLLKDVHKRVSEPGESQPFSYLASVVEDRLRALDPSALPPKAPKMGGLGGLGGPGGDLQNMSDEQIKELIKQMQQQKGGAPK
jgi:hypothetical protein